MILRRYSPGPPLNAFVHWFWLYDQFCPDHDREHALPDGTFELIINLQDRKRKLFDRDAAGRFTTFRRAWLSGARSGYLVIDAVQRSSMMGAHFKPGGAAPFLGMPADEVQDQVVELDALWGDETVDWRDQLLEAPGPEAKFQLLERILIRRLLANHKAASADTWISQALHRLALPGPPPAIRALADELGVSHKHFIQAFRRRVGLPPKLFGRILRFQDALGQITAGRPIDWTDVALHCGYYDQAHFINDFQQFSGLNPTAYGSRRLEDPNFVRADS